MKMCKCVSITGGWFRELSENGCAAFSIELSE